MSNEDFKFFLINFTIKIFLLFIFKEKNFLLLNKNIINVFNPQKCLTVRVLISLHYNLIFYLTFVLYRTSRPRKGKEEDALRL